jgi:hypothetical protein
MRQFAYLAFFISIFSACDTGKESVSDLPFAGDYEEGKEDSWRYPTAGGHMLVGQLETGSFDAATGWVGYEIDLAAGPVELRLVDAHDGVAAAELDTLLVVYGPKQANGRYPSRALAVNDDAVPGANLSSLLALEVAEPGTYRVVASTYDNYAAYPRNVSRGMFALSAWCQLDGDEACGPELRDLGEGCFDDWQCGDGNHCEGEITCPAGTQCLWVREGACVQDTTWLAYAPRQCGQNAWQLDPSSGDGEDGGYRVPELEEIDAFFEGQGIELESLGRVDLPTDVVCLSCSCSRGDVLVVEALSVDAGALVDGFDFAAVDVDAWSALSPVQCGGNAWEESPDPYAEIAAVRAWAEAAGAPVANVGFVHAAQPEVQCRACSCPRGDRLVVTPVDATAREGLPALGFGSLVVD